VSDEHVFAEGCGFPRSFLASLLRGGGRDDFGGDAGEVAPVGLILRAEEEGDEAGAGFDDGVVELAGEVVAEGGCAHFWDGEASGGDDDGRGGDGALSGFDAKFPVGVGDGEDGGGELDAGAGVGALAEEQVEDVVGGAVAEELAEGFLVVGDGVFFDEGDEVARGVAGEGGLGEVGVGGEKVFGRGVEVGEVAAASAGD
jgi:hypothetical protein